jgi:uncharacterized protein YrrD
LIETFDRDIDDIRGAAVYGLGDEKLGKIDDVIFDSDNGQIRYVVVHTGGWLSSRRFLVPLRNCNHLLLTKRIFLM